MRTKIKLSESYLKNIEAHNPAIHEEIEQATKDAEVDSLIVKRSAVPTASDFKIASDEEQTVVGMSSTRGIDRDNEVIVPQGVNLDQFRQAPVKLFNHSWNELPVGKVPSIKAVKNGLLSKTVFGGTTFADEVWKAVQFGSLRTNSIGFIPTAKVFQGDRDFGEVVDKLDKRWDGFAKTARNISSIIVKSILLEDSIVPVPANPEALVQAVSSKSLAIRAESLEAMGFEVKVFETEDECLEDLYDSLHLINEKNLTEEEGDGEEIPPETLENAEEKHNDNDSGEKKPTVRLVMLGERKNSAEDMLRKVQEEVAWLSRKHNGKIF